MLHRGSSVTRLSVVWGYEMVEGNVKDVKASSGGVQKEKGGA